MLCRVLVVMVAANEPALSRFDDRDVLYRRFVENIRNLAARVRRGDNDLLVDHADSS